MGLKISGIPSARSTVRQREFFDIRRMSHGLCRYYAGDFFEQATSALTGAARLKTDSRRVTCPDLQFSSHQFLESKSVGKTNEAIIYKTRLERDADFCNIGNELFYCFWNHSYRVSEADCKYDLHSKLAGHVSQVLILPFSVLWEKYRDLPPKLLNNALAKNGKKIGWGSNGYGLGWNVPLAPLAALCTRASTISVTKVYDTAITNLRVLCHPAVPANLIALPSIEWKAGVLLEELLSSRLEVAKWPSPRGEGYIRGCVSVNTEWYSEFCKRFERRPCRRYWKAGRTAIKRIQIIAALRKIAAGPDNVPKKSPGRCNPGCWKTPNVMRLLDFMHDWCRDWSLEMVKKNHDAWWKAMSPAEKREWEEILAKEF